jgi:hypothetical protein
MALSTPKEQISIAVGHIADADSMDAVCKTLRVIHGEAYDFAVSGWQGEADLVVQPGRRRTYFIMDATDARVSLAPGHQIRGIPPAGPYQPLEEPQWAEATAPMQEAIWPGDVLCVDSAQPLKVSGKATCFLVESEATAYPAPAAAFLRHLTDRPGGCAAYPGAFRRETLPPVRALADAPDKRGVNRVNEHTLDMRVDRDPRPQPHYHGPVAVGDGEVVNHSETALVLPRAVYGLPPVDDPESGRVVIYPQADSDPSHTQVIPVRPGSIVVTPATVDGVAGHCFENAFAMLLAIPGFVSPHNAIR